MSNCEYCDIAERLRKGKTTFTRDDLVYWPIFILDGGNDHLPPDHPSHGGIGPRELREATTHRRWVHDMRAFGAGIVKCKNEDARDEFITQGLSRLDDANA